MTRAWRITSAVALLLASAAVLLAAVLFSTIQSERANASVQACLRESVGNEAILTYLESLGASEMDVDQAARFFPVLNQEQCERRAKKTVSSPRPK